MQDYEIVNPEVFEDLTGQKIGHLTIIKLIVPKFNKIRGGGKWECRCKCGKTLNRTYTQIKKHKKPSCGCAYNIPVKPGDYEHLVVREYDKTTKKYDCTCKKCGQQRYLKRNQVRDNKSCGCVNKKLHLTGHKYGRLTVIKKMDNSTTKWQCKCDCGSLTSVFAENLRSGHTRSCGCLAHELNAEDITGKIFGKLTAVGELPRTHSGPRWRCSCSCGGESEVFLTNLKRGHTKSCGCLQHTGKASFKHGMCGTKVHATWCGIKARCLNPNDTQYKNYGGRGIKICDRWKEDFRNFYEDMGDCQKEHSIERIDVNGNYCPENCK